MNSPLCSANYIALQIFLCYTTGMFVSKKKLRNPGSYAVQLVESKRREDGKVRQNIIKYIGHAIGEKELEQLMTLGNQVKDMVLKNSSDKKIDAFVKKNLSQIKGSAIRLDTCSVIHKKITGIHDIFCPIVKSLKLNELLKNKNYNHALQNMIISRIASPTSKRNSVRILKDDFGIDIPLSHVYRSMDKMDDDTINKIKTNIQQYNTKLLNNEVKVLFYDATTLYFESFKEDELKKNGYSKDLKFNQPQVLLTILVTDAGLPIGYEVFPGSTYEGHTLQNAIKTLTNKYAAMDLVLVADSGMLNQDNIDYLENNNIKYIMGARIKNQNKVVKEQILSIRRNKTKETFLTVELSDTKTLIVSYKEARANKDRYDREKSIKSIEKRLKKSKDPKNLLNNHGYKKFLEIKGKTDITINQEKILLEQQWDGLHGVITNTNVDIFSAEEIYAQYRGLWQVEEAFRVNKTDLKIRPIYHWTPRRIHAHLAISYISFSCIRLLQFLLRQSGLALSCAEIKYHLSRCEVTVVQDSRSNKVFNMPSLQSDIAKSIYKIMNIKYDNFVYESVA